jgi:hypothetical protein
MQTVFYMFDRSRQFRPEAEPEKNGLSVRVLFQFFRRKSA